MGFYKNNWLIFIIIFLLAIAFRFTNFDNRWTLSQDQARDAIIAQVSIQNNTLPLVGPPSSVGKFSFGPFYYWLITFFSFLFPSVVNAPWIGFAVLSLIPIFLFYLIGKDLGNKTFGLILASIASFASGPVFHSSDMLNPIPIIWSTSIVLFCLVKMVEKKQIYFSYLLGLSIGIAINFHFQALGLLVMPFLVLILIKDKLKKRLFALFLSILGIFTSFIPLIIFNFQVEGQLFLNILDFSSSSGRSLRSMLGMIKDLGVFWPQLFGEVLVFIPNFGYLFYLIFILSTGFIFWKKEKISKTWLIIILTLVVQVIILRIYSGARTPVYLLVFHPFIIFLTGFSIWFVWQKKKIAGISLLIIFLLASTWSNIKIIQGFTQKPLIYQIKKQIDEKSRGTVNFYTFKDSGMISLPLYYLLLKEKRISTQGYKIGTCSDYVLDDGKPFCPIEPVPFYRKENYPIYDLSTTSDDKIRSVGLDSLTEEKIYKWLMDYYQK